MAEIKVEERIFDFAQDLVIASDGILTLVKHEHDDSRNEDKKADSFLKLNKVRLGRDLKLYAFMVEIMGLPSMLTFLLQELLLPLRDYPAIYSKGSSILKEWGLEVFEDEMADKWVGLFEISSPPANA